MTVRIAYFLPASARIMRLSLIRNVILFVFFLLILTLRSLSQDLPEYDQLSVFLEIPSVGGGEIDALIREEELYLPVTDFFDFLKIRNVPSPDLETITGFFINEDAVYSIYRPDNLIRYQDRIFDLEQGDLIKTESNLFLRISCFGKVFGLDCSFNFRSLSVTVKSKLELPLIREMRQEEMRRNISRLKGEVQADTVIGRTYPLFKFGMADWSVISSQEADAGSDTRINLALGSMLAGGEATASLYYNSSDPFTEKQQYYLWRYVNNDFAPLRQVMAGKIRTNSVSSIFNPVIGIQVTNTPTTYRRSFGTYTLSDRTEPGWIVELYVNNVLVDYVKSDASGFFTFEVPLVYGNSLVKLRFFGPWGEERTREQNINIPYNFLPEKTLEYTLSAGIVEDTVGSRFSRGTVSYGVTRGLTVGGGVEYLSSVSSGPVMPYVNASLRLGGNLLLSGEYTHGVRAKGTLTYRLPSNLQFDLNYTWYEKDQKAIFYNYREERKATVSIPLKIGKLATYQRFTLYQIVLPYSKYTTGEWLLSGSLFGVNTNLTTYALMVGNVKPYFYSNLSMAFRLPAGFVLMPQAQYGYTENKLFSAKVRLEKHLLENAYLNLSYEQNFRNNLKMAEVGLRYDFSFAQAGVSARLVNNKPGFIEYARGSLINDKQTNYLGTDNRPNVGRGGISIVPFLDLNNNGRKDPGEPKAGGLNLHSSAGRIEKDERDTTIRILGLEPYTSCFIDLDPDSFDNLAWRLLKQTYNVVVDPNILKLIEIPVSIVGEATGHVTHEKDGEMAGIGRIIVHFYRDGMNPAGKALTEDDGYFSCFGLIAGNYTARIDTTQLRKLGMISDPVFRQFNITGNIDGDIIDGIDFILHYLKSETTDTVKLEPQEKERQDTTYTIIHEITEESLTITEDCYAIQVAAFKRRPLAEAMRRRVQAILPQKDVQVTIEGEYFRVRIFEYKTRPDVDADISVLEKYGFTKFWVVRLLAKQQQRILIEEVDSLAGIREMQIEKPGETILLISPDMSIQVGAFLREANAVALRNRMSSLLDKKVSIVPEGGYFKVRITGFTSIEEMEKMVPALELLGVRDIWILPVKEPVIYIPEPGGKAATEIYKAEVIPDTAISIVTITDRSLVLDEKAEIPEPSIALQVGIFHKESQALRAQKRIMSKLNLPVEIIRQWDYFHVIVTGFYTREETYEYYPELAGLGYPGITLLLDYKRNKK